MADETIISSTDEIICEKISKSVYPKFLKPGDFYKFIKNIKKNNYSSQKNFISYFNSKADELENILKKDYRGTINLIENYFMQNPGLIRSVTSVYDIPIEKKVSRIQICAMTNNFSTFGGMNKSFDNKFVCCTSKRSSINKYSQIDGEGWDQSYGFYKYFCQTHGDIDHGKMRITKINYDIINEKLDVAVFEEWENSLYCFKGIFEANKIYDENTKPFFKLLLKDRENILNDDLEDVSQITQEYSEGNKVLYKGVRYERNQAARAKCIQLRGSTCKICGFNFEATYGPDARGYIHVHHIVPLNKKTKPYILDPEEDLIPVCPNCHSMLHRFDCGVDKIRNLLTKNKKLD